MKRGQADSYGGHPDEGSEGAVAAEWMGEGRVLEKNPTLDPWYRCGSSGTDSVRQRCETMKKVAFGERTARAVKNI